MKVSRGGQELQAANAEGDVGRVKETEEEVEEGGREGGEGEGGGGDECGEEGEGGGGEGGSEGGREGGEDEKEREGEKKTELIQQEGGGLSTVTSSENETVNEDTPVDQTLKDRATEEGEGEGEAGGEREEREGDSPTDRERKAYKDQLLKSAGIQLQGSSEPDIAGAPSMTADQTVQSSEDRNLEQFSEILLDSDLSPTNSEVGVGVGEGAELEGGGVAEGEGLQGGGVAGEEGGRGKSERRVRFADEIMESTDTAGTAYCV